uniref:hypothetical protein n=1 Tax=uncultured Sphingomonas sp. TaxID=158754 RepID=UPI0035CB97E0
MLRSLVCALALLPLAACDDGKGGTSISINSSDDNGAASIDGNGEATIDTPFFKGKVQIPKLKLDASNFDMNGVHLYPGSTIGAMNIDAQDRPVEDNDGQVRVTFASPAAASTVRDWFKAKLTAAKFKVEAKGNGLVGKTDEGHPFSLDLTPAGPDKADGVIHIG